MSEKNEFKAGDKVAFRTPGRFPKDYVGTIKTIDSAFAVVDVTSHIGVGEKKARPGTLRAA